MRQLLRQAAWEIQNLRRQNEILRARNEVVEVFSAALLGPKTPGGMEPDLAQELEATANKMQADEKIEQEQSLKITKRIQAQKAARKKGRKEAARSNA